MIVTFWKGVFVADHEPGDVRLLKKAGFGDCRKGPAINFRAPRTKICCRI